MIAVCCGSKIYFAELFRVLALFLAGDGLRVQDGHNYRAPNATGRMHAAGS